MIEGFVALHLLPNRIAMTDSASTQEQPHAAPASAPAAPVVAEAAVAVATPESPAAPAAEAGAPQPQRKGGSRRGGRNRRKPEGRQAPEGAAEGSPQAAAPSAAPRAPQRVHPALEQLAALYPHLWLGMIVGTVAICYTVYLLYVGIPTFMNIPEDEGFMFSSSVLATVTAIRGGQRLRRGSGGVLLRCLQRLRRRFSTGRCSPLRTPVKMPVGRRQQRAGHHKDNDAHGQPPGL